MPDPTRTSLGLLMVRALPVLDLTRYALGDDLSRHPSSHQGTWLDRLGWGLDSHAAAARMLLAGNTTGAAGVLRVQLERWTANRAETLELAQTSTESTNDIMERVWSLGPRPREGASIGAAWQALSETLHGRGSLVDWVRWETLSLAGGPPPKMPVSFITASESTAAQVAECYADVAWRRGHQKLADAALTAQVEDRIVPNVHGGYVELLLPTSWQVVNNFSSGHAAGRTYLAAVRRFVASGARPSFPELGAPFYAFAERRSRMAKWCMRGFEREKSMDPVGFAPYSTPETGVTLTSEMAALAGSWVEPEGESHPLVFAASALRAALWLWSDDDDRSMTLCRTVVECVARVRVHRTKAEVAARYEREKKPASAWVRAAGWPELLTLTGALSELSHVTSRSRWSGAQAALISHASDLESPHLRARRQALEAITGLVSEEVAETLDSLDRALAAAWRDLSAQGQLSQPLAAVRHLGDSLRSLSFGEPDIQSIDPDDDWYMTGLKRTTRRTGGRLT